ncbi:acetyltransferase [Rhizohabitans arisaemae]|uniref:acetyltransferase n=1 Tax=Rhizohabitans arisaemae TaxID=2720610 RepID=UPI0024B24EF2|nr:acetyltransferase [Rhizohabitans arisaemae]
MTELVIVGAGGFSRETAQNLPPGIELLGFVDDDPARHGTRIDGVPVLGGTEVIAELDPEVRLVVCTGRPSDNTSRPKIVARLGLPPERYRTLCHPTALVAPSCTVGPGSVLLPYTVLTASVRVGAHVAVMPHVVLTHDDVIEDYVTIAAGARLAGGVHVGEAAYIGSGALIREGLTVGAHAVVGMGAVVTRHVPPGEVWAGNPARRFERTPR